MADLSATHWVQQLARILLAKDLRCAVAESCTGGLIAAAMTAYPGSSQWFDCGIVSYSNAAKQTLLGVTPAIINQYGAVSQETVTAMAEGILQRSQANLRVAVSGIAGPGGGSAEKPVGLVHLALAIKNKPTVHVRCLFAQTTRTEIRLAAVKKALDLLQEAAQPSKV